MENKKEINYEYKLWHAILIILIILILFNSSWIFGDEDYNECVDECVGDVKFCGEITKYDENMRGYISEADYNDCYYDLYDCVRECD